MVLHHDHTNQDSRVSSHAQLAAFLCGIQNQLYTWSWYKNGEIPQSRFQQGHILVCSPHPTLAGKDTALWTAAVLPGTGAAASLLPPVRGNAANSSLTEKHSSSKSLLQCGARWCFPSTHEWIWFIHYYPCELESSLVFKLVWKGPRVRTAGSTSVNFSHFLSSEDIYQPPTTPRSQMLWPGTLETGTASDKCQCPHVTCNNSSVWNGPQWNNPGVHSLFLPKHYQLWANIQMTSQNPPSFKNTFQIPTGAFHWLEVKKC